MLPPPGWTETSRKSGHVLTFSDVKFLSVPNVIPLLQQVKVNNIDRCLDMLV